MKKVFVDGSAGTTGLRIYQRLEKRTDIERITLPQQLRKDETARKQAIQQADIVFLCLPDEAARRAVELAEGSNAVILDTSTAHRTAPGWVYGFPELSKQHREVVQQAKRIAVPGCHASGFIALIAPLIQAGILSPTQPLSCHSITGYSGGGKAMIAQYEEQNRSSLLKAPRQYGLSQQHKHLKEMQAICGIAQPPLFSPIVADFYSGMEVTVPIFGHQLQKNAGIEQIKAVYQEQYQGAVVQYQEQTEDGFLSAAALSGNDGMQIMVQGCEERILLVARYDNLGKGASGAAIQCMNLVLGQPETQGLELD